MWCCSLVLMISFIPNSSRVLGEADLWGFYPHKMINKHAIYTLPPAMIHFYQNQEDNIVQMAVNPDRRRYAIKGEGVRHFIDLDRYPETVSELWTRSRMRNDTLSQELGILPWHLMKLRYQLTYAFRACDLEDIVRYSAEAGHYLADAHVPLHTTSNYNGQYTNQKGIHGFWETRVPEVLWAEFDLWVGKARYWEDITCEIWDIIWNTHQAVDSVLYWECHLSDSLPEQIKYSYESRNKRLIRTYSETFLRAYHQKLDRKVERQIRKSIRAVGNFWYSCWLDAGQPSLLWQGDDEGVTTTPVLDRRWKNDPQNRF